MAGKYLNPIVICSDCASNIARLSSCASSHQASDFLIGIKAAHVSPSLPKGGDLASNFSFSWRVVYLKLLVTPCSTHLVSAFDGIINSLTISKRSMGYRPFPVTLLMDTTFHDPLYPPINEYILFDIIFPPYPIIFYQVAY